MTFRNFFGLILMIIFLTSCTQPANNYSSEADINMIQVVLRRFSSETYLFQLDNNVLKVTQGRRQGDMEDDDFIEKERYDEVCLSKDQYDELLLLANNIDDNQKPTFRDSWVVEAIIGNIRVESTYGASQSEALDELVTKFIELSPIEVVSSSGQKVTPVKLPN